MGDILIVFDVDGTLVGGEPTDWASFEGAFEETAGFALDSAFWESLEEVTAQAVVHQALKDSSPEKKAHMVHAVRDGYLRRLRAAHENDSSSFPALEGALALLEELKKQGVAFAIGTGDWFETSTFKLGASGIRLDSIPMVTSSDFYTRGDIIAGAAAKAGRRLQETVYVGDGLWDLRTCQKLGIPFIGVGRRKEKLEHAGATYTLPDLSPASFWRVMDTIRGKGSTPYNLQTARPLP
ncbi:MAG TPA: HAD hydrolase-like protein [Verrucomicrobiae bacterium]|nr:HAD hydrolase-like protein [Verrucomicrobiae bacterium]